MKRRDFLKTPALGLILSGEGPLSLAGRPAPQDGSLDSHSLLSQEVQQRMHPDLVTYVPGIEYFFVGNGDILGIVQHSPQDSQMTLVGFTLMNPERFCRKWSTFLYHPERGFTATKLGVTVDEGETSGDAKTGMFTGVKGYTMGQNNLKSIAWKYPDGVPVVSVVWMAGEHEVEEEFFVPHEGEVLFRRVTVKNRGEREAKASLSLSLYANFGLFDDIGTDPNEKTAHAYGIERMKLQALGANVSVSGRYDVRIDLGSIGAGQTRHAVYAYSIKEGDTLLRSKGFEKLWKETVAYWSARPKLETGHQALDGFVKTSMSGMKAVVARGGKMDAAPWMYNMEWVSDQALAIEALLHAGMAGQAKIMMERNLRNSIGPDGRTIESSRWFGFDYTELNQNGMLLYAIWVYLAWTGDTALIRKYWNKIKLCAEFPLRKEFQGPAPKLVRNKREFWERSDVHGVEDGYEMVYQFWVSYGLEKGAAVAEALDKRATAASWLRTSEEIKDTMLNHRQYRLIEEGHLIKRRTLAGEWQRAFIPPDRKRMPPGSPLASEEHPSPEPDTVEAYPIVYGFIDPRGSLATGTLAWLERLWNQRWIGGGYPRYNVSSEDNPPAPWPLASLIVARAYAEAGDEAKVWRVVDWLKSLPGGNAGSWFERYGQSITPPHPPVSVINWPWYEVLSLVVQQILGIRPQMDHLLVRPHLLKGLDKVHGVVNVRGSEIEISVHRTSRQNFASVDGKNVDLPDGSLNVPYPLKKRHVLGFSLT